LAFIAITPGFDAGGFDLGGSRSPPGDQYRHRRRGTSCTIVLSLPLSCDFPCPEEMVNPTGHRGESPPE
jgi:hypothetical protein